MRPEVITAIHYIQELRTASRIQLARERLEADDGYSEEEKTCLMGWLKNQDFILYFDAL